MKNIMISIFAISLWSFILSDLYKDSSSKFLTKNKCYKVDGEKIKLLSKKKMNYYFSNKKEISYYSPYWIFNNITEVSCKGSRSLASSTKSFHFLRKTNDYMIETIEVFQGKR